MFNRIFLFLATNLAIIFVLNITMRLLGFDVYLASTGQDLTGLLVFAALIGMARAQALDLGAKHFAQTGALELDLSGVERADSAGLALLLEWKRLTQGRGQPLRLRNIPRQLRNLALVSGVDAMLGMEGERQA